MNWKFHISSILGLCIVGLLITTAFAVEGSRTQLIVSFDQDIEFAFTSDKGVTSKSSIYQSVNRLTAKHGLIEVRPLWRGSYAPLKNIYVLTFPAAKSEASAQSMVREFRGLSKVSQAALNTDVEIIGEPEEVIPDDFWFNNSYPWDDHEDCYPDPTHQRQWYLPRENFKRAWAISTGDSAQAIVIMDSGLDCQHHDFVDRVLWNMAEVNGTTGVDDDGNGYIDDISGWDFGNDDSDVNHDPHGSPEYTGQSRHGTAMASTFGASTNNESDPAQNPGIASQVWRNKIMVCKIFYGHLNGNWQYHVAAAIEAYNYIFDYQDRHNQEFASINMSWITGTSINSTLETLFIEANQRGILPVGGAGNSNAGFVYYPCKSDYVLCAACLDSTGTKLSGTSGSNYGSEVNICGFGSKNCDGNWCAPRPGKAFQLQILSYETNDPYGWRFCGSEEPHIIGFTSMLTSGATSQGSGMAGMVKSVYPTLSGQQVQAMIERGAVSVDALNPGLEGLLGAGYIDAYRTLTLWGTIDSDTTLAGEVWIGGDVVVADGVTLTIAAGTLIHVAADDIEPADGYAGQDPDRIEIFLEGALAVNGSGGSEVVMEGWSDDPEAGDWVGFIIDAQTDGVTASHFEVRHAETAFDIYRCDATLSDCVIEYCGMGIDVTIAGGNFTDITVGHCSGTGIRVIGDTRVGSVGGISDADFDGCLVFDCNLGYHFGEKADDCVIDNGSQAVSNTTHGILCECPMSIGGGVLVDGNGANGIQLDGSGDATITGVTVQNHSSGRGIHCINGSNPVVGNSEITANQVNVSCLSNSRPIIGDDRMGIGGNNIITNAGQYYLINGTKIFTLKAENCYWGFGGQIPINFAKGRVDIAPMLMTPPSIALIPTDPVQPRESWASDPFPNPFNPETRFRLYVEGTGRLVTIDVFDVAGRRIRTLQNGIMASGHHSVIWNGRNDQGESVSSGLYFSKIRIGADYERNVKLLLVK
ncbi:MAG: S8 family serine peptidase [bacterium]|nr:S8 family serine peptidase [bacterium]